MSTTPLLPLIDPRRPAEIEEQVRQLLYQYLRAQYGWQSWNDGGEAGKALTGVFAHYCGLIIDRINRAPAKNFLAFLDLLGNSPLPPQPARVPLTFFLDPSATEGTTVPAGTRVQADPGEGTNEPTLFETEEDLWLTPFELKAFAKGPDDGSPLTDLTTLVKTLKNKDEIAQSDEEVFAEGETYFFGLDLPQGRALPANRPVSLYLFIGTLEYDPASKDILPELHVNWRYSSSSNGTWHELLIEDETQWVTRSGSVTFLVPKDFSRAKKSLKDGNQPSREEHLFWIRVSLPPGATYQPAPRLRGLAPNTVVAQQAVSIRNEILGSSNGTPGQVFTTFRKPVLPGQRVEIREHRATATTTADVGREEWVAWQEVADFHGSTPMDRHYLVDRHTGQIRFGNGQAGMIPPMGTRNVRIAWYHTGGGSAGNVAPRTVKTLVTGGRYIEKVTNFVAATGGADAETADSLLERAPKALRHRYRAATIEDYEDLAKLASPEVARALCVPLLDLAQQPSKVITTPQDEISGAGKVSVIIVPRMQVVNPLPTQTLMRHVETYLRDLAVPTASISVVGPLYLQVKITVTLKLQSIGYEDQVKRKLHEAFTDFLHPLTGRYGHGWPFGRRPHESDIHRLIGTVAGIDHVQSLKIELEADNRPFDCDGTDSDIECIEKTGRFLIYSGQHNVTTT
jgi:hypothetical protein